MLPVRRSLSPFTAGSQSPLEAGTPGVVAFAEGARTAFLVSAIVVGVALVASLFVWEPQTNLIASGQRPSPNPPTQTIELSAASETGF